MIKTDRRFSLVDLKVNTANVDAKLRAIARPAPVGSLPLSALQEKINKKLYDGKKILVIGGSRGIGAYAVKILALMGANITFSYAKGLQDSIELKKELKDAEISINFVHFDVTKPCFDKLLECDPDYIFYFATPKIFVKRSKNFENELYARFKLYYVDAFEALLKHCIRSSVKGIFYPSSIAIDEESRELLEYIRAKLEGESLCAKYDGQDGLKILVKRLPRTTSDQTATHLMIESENPLEVLMPIFEEFYD